MKIQLTERQRNQTIERVKYSSDYALPEDVMLCSAKTWAFHASIVKMDSIHPPYNENHISEAECALEQAGRVKKKRKPSTSKRWYKITKVRRLCFTASTVKTRFKSAFPTPRQLLGYTSILDEKIINRSEDIRRLAATRRDIMGIRRSLYGAPTPYPKQQECFSVELEFVANEGSALAQDYEYPFTKNVEFVGDSSVSPIAGQVSSLYKEVRISMVWGKVERLFQTCAILRRDGAAVNKSCGLHVHLDSRHLTARGEALRRSRLVAALPWLLELVPESRRNNSFCIPNHLPGVGRHQRYCAINPTSFRKHMTTEIRLGSGTIDPDKILNWATLLHYISDSNRRFKTFESFLRSKAPQHIKVWAVLRRNKFYPTAGLTTECGETA